jgi:secretion/DNA translocation related TadE-like protein
MTVQASDRAPRLGQTHDSGSATVLVLIGCAVIAAALALVAVVTLVVYAQHGLASSADLAALAGATHLDEGASAVCMAAADIARANHTELVQCQRDASSVSVSVRLVPTSDWWSSWAERIVGRGRAGYASPTS